MSRRLKCFWCALGFIVLNVVLVWPVGTWLQCRDMHVGGEDVDAIYLVAGAKHQNQRVEALKRYLSSDKDFSHMKVLVGWDAQTGKWNRDLQKNLSIHDWAVYKIEKVCEEQRLKNIDIILVSGGFTGTDGEMEVLAEYLKNIPEITSLAVVTSPFHVRRVLWRLQRYMETDMRVRVIYPEPRWVDRAPWTVVGEVLKMTRDKLGWSRVPVISREKLR